MNIFEQKRQVRRLLYSKMAMLGLLFLCGFLINGLVNIYGKARESMDRKNFSAQSLIQLQEREAALQAEIERLDSRTGLEEELRNRYSLSKEGERMIIIIEDEKDKRAATSTEEVGFTDKAATWIKRAILIE